MQQECIIYFPKSLQTLWPIYLPTLYRIAHVLLPLFISLKHQRQKNSQNWVQVPYFGIRFLYCLLRKEKYYEWVIWHERHFLQHSYKDKHFFCTKKLQAWSSPYTGSGTRSFRGFSKGVRNCLRVCRSCIANSSYG